MIKKLHEKSNDNHYYSTEHFLLVGHIYVIKLKIIN